jgi:DnaA N-terminal domain
LVAFALASFADRDHLAHPGTPAAAGRAGLSKSRFLKARDGLVRRGLLVVELPATGRGRACTLGLPFASDGPWWDGDINAELFEAVLGYSRAQGSARLLLAAMAALANERSVVEGFTTAELCSAAGITERTYSRVRGPLVGSGELVLRSATCGRGNTNSWEIPDLRAGAAGAAPRRRRVSPPPGARPPVASVPSPGAAEEGCGGDVVGQIAGDGGHERRVADARKGRHDRMLFSEKRPDLSGISAAKGCQDRTLPAQNSPALSGVSLEKGRQVRTVSRETQAQNPAQTPAANARAAREPQNPRTIHPPSPPERGSSADQVLVQETDITERGRRRQRVVAVPLGAVRERLRAAGKEDLADWEQARACLLEAVGESTFEIWLAPLELLAVDVEGTLIVSAPAEAASWIVRRFGRVLDGAAQHVGRPLRVADEVERKAAASLVSIAPLASSRRVPSARSAGRRDDQSTRKPTYTSAHPSSYPDVYTQQKEVSG